jgi:hypothetical protein
MKYDNKAVRSCLRRLIVEIGRIAETIDTIDTMASTHQSGACHRPLESIFLTLARSFGRCLRPKDDNQ